jgi:hypothetical protein
MKRYIRRVYRFLFWWNGSMKLKWLRRLMVRHRVERYYE